MLYVLNFINTIISAKFEEEDCNPSVNCKKPLSVGGLIEDIKEEIIDLSDLCKPLFHNLPDDMNRSFSLNLKKAIKHTNTLCNCACTDKNLKDIESILKQLEDALEDVQINLIDIKDVVCTKPIAIVRSALKNVKKAIKKLR